MSKELCFCIEKKNLYLEQVLVDYMDIPIFFLCKNGNQYYVILCTDIDESIYAIVKTSSSEIYDLLHGRIPMRNIFLNQKEYWEVTSGDHVSLDTVIKYSTTHLSPSLLPEENACFQILTEEINAYVKAYDNDFFGMDHFKLVDKKRPFNKIPINLIDDLSNTKLEIFKNLGDYTFKTQMKRQSEPAFFTGGEYISQFEKTVIFQKSYDLCNWKNSEAINASA